MTRSVRFEEEADAEYRAAGRWYESHRTGLGLEFFDAVDATLDNIVRFPNAGASVPRVSRELQSEELLFGDSRITSFISK